ncbi:MAG TPA: TonB-dependent receptor [Fluviicola sp.]|nr:TonB-dependent receptor [Fluviicola sp.]
MARNISRYGQLLGALTALLLAVDGWGQTVSGTVVGSDKQPVFGLSVACGNVIGQTDIDGKFSLPCSGPKLAFFSEELDTIFITIEAFEKQGSKLELKQSATDLQEVEIKSRLLFFDIGYLPPIKGVQIATGTSSIIQTEGQSGAKSTGNPRELFAKVPGLNIWESDGAGIQMGVGGRGLSPNRAANFNMRQNGYDISADALGYPESYYTPPLEALSAIEIIRGSASLQYGTQFGGLMNFVMKEPNQHSPIEFTTRNTVGSYGYIGTFNRISGRINRFEYQAYYQLKTGDGYRINSDFTQHQGFAQVGYYINEYQRIRVEYTRMSYLAQQAGGLTDKQFEEDPLQSVRDRNWFKVNWNVLALHYDWEISKATRFNVRAFGMLSQRLSLGFLGKISQADPGGNREVIRGDFKNAGVEARLLHRYSVSKKSSILGVALFGVRYYQGQTTSIQGTATAGRDADFTMLNPDDPENSSYSFPSQNAAAFVENIWFIKKRWTVNAGARLEYITSASEGFYKQYSIHPLNFDTLAVYKIEDENQLTRTVPLAGIGTSFKTGKLSSLYANFCMNYRAVNFTDIRINNPNIIVDTMIRDEYGSTTELGWRGFVVPYLYVDVAAFYLFYGDKIGLAPETNGVKKVRTNIGDAVNTGVELLVEFDFIKAFRDSAKVSSSVFVNFSYIDAKYLRSKESNYVGKQVEYVSPVLLRGGFKIRHDRWSAQLQGSYNSSQFADASNAIEPSGDAVIGEIPAYFVLDFSARYAFRKFFQLEFGVNNMLNSSYYTRRATAYPGPGILPSDGINFYTTLQFKLGEGK